MFSIYRLSKDVLSVFTHMTLVVVAVLSEEWVPVALLSVKRSKVLAHVLTDACATRSGSGHDATQTGAKWQQSRQCFLRLSRDFVWAAV